MPRPSHLPMELLETFISVLEHEGDAARAAESMAINQPSISKRLATLRRSTADRTGEPWLVRKGKRWHITAEGQRIRPVVAELVYRYQQMERFVTSGLEGKNGIAFACGQQAASSFVRDAIVHFQTEQPQCRLRLSTPRGRARIQGVAGGQFDIACVTDSPATIRRVARTDLFVEPLMEDRFVLAACPPAGSIWGKRWLKRLESRAVAAADLADLPFILPEPDASRRTQFDDWNYRATGRLLDVVLEVGGWQTILDYVSQGIGVGLVPASAVKIFGLRGNRRLSVRLLDVKEFPPDEVRLISRKAHGRDEPSLSEPAARFRELLHDAAKEL